MSNNSPYIPGNTVRDTDMFYGRIDELAELTNAIGKGSSKAVVGLRRIGKSSLLYHLAHHAVLPDHIAIAYIDLLDARYHTVSGLLGGILHGLNQITNHRYSPPDSVDITGFTTIVTRIKSDGYQPVICLDELERLMSHPETFNRDFFEAWRALGSMGTLAFVTASRVRITDVVQHNGSTSPFTNIFTQLTLAGLQPNAARALLTEPFRRAPERNEPPAAHVDYALTLSGCHPYFLQLAGDTLWHVGSVNREQFRQRISAAIRGPMQQLWDDLSPTEQAAAVRLATGKGAVPNWEDEIANLLHIGLAESGFNNQPRLFSDLLREWLQKGSFQQSASLRPIAKTPDTKKPTILDPTQPPPRPFYASAFIFLVGLAVIALLSQWLGWGVFSVLIFLAIYLAYTLVGEGKISGREFLDALDKWIRNFLGQ